MAIRLVEKLPQACRGIPVMCNQAPGSTVAADRLGRARGGSADRRFQRRHAVRRRKNVGFVILGTAYHTKGTTWTA